jgi:hypothetical protein
MPFLLSYSVCSKGFYWGYLGLTNRLLVEGGGSVCWVFLDAGPCNIFKQSQALPIYKYFINFINSKRPNGI